MTTLFDGELHVHYGFVYLEPKWSDPIEDLRATRGGQVNGICGAAYPGVLAMTTGLHTGAVRFAVSVTENAPSLDDSWEDVVEVSFTADDVDYSLSTFEDGAALILPRPGSYRARYCAFGMDAGHGLDTRTPGDEIAERYLLAIWPAPPASDAIVRQTGEVAAYWHSVAVKTSPPPPPPSPEEVAAAAAEKDRLRAEADRRFELSRWGGTEPSPALRAAGAPAMDLARTDRPLAEQLAAMSPADQRRVAVWLVRDACERAGPGPLDWRPAIFALQQNEPLPAPFDDRRSAVQALYPNSTVTASVSTSSQPMTTRMAIHPPSAALAAVFAAANDDTAAAVFGALTQTAAALDEPNKLYVELRRAFDLD